ncbi:hypothetical protein [Secundilactobacillus muriivasis]
MKLSKYVLLGVTALSLGAGLAATTETANAATYTPRSWRGTYYMNTDSGRSYMKVNTYSVVLNGKTMYKNTWSGWKKLSFKRISSADAVTKKHKLYTFNSLAKYGYQSSRQWRLTTKNGKKELINYQVQGYIDVWHKVSASTAKYKSFHGYRVANSKSDYTYNTFYDTDSHATLSDYRPTQKSKVIFRYGSHVYPTSHEWTWFHGTDQNLLTDYRYIGGSWVKQDTTDVSDD